MARIATNTTGSQPSIFITTGVDQSNAVQPVPVFTASGANAALAVPFVQDLTVTNSTGIYSYSTFSDVDMRKLSTPADNELSFNVVVDDTAWFGGAAGADAASAAAIGLQKLSGDKTYIGFRIYYNNDDGKGANSSSVTQNYKEGVGYITSLAPTVSPEAPVWVTPMTIAVDGYYTNAANVLPS